MPNILFGPQFCEILAEPQESPRPTNAPPTYDDAMKFVNSAFALEEGEEEAPPSYSPRPREGEEAPGPPPSSCSCPRPGGAGRPDGAEARFADDFSDIDLSSLPQDPPPYAR